MFDNTWHNRYFAPPKIAEQMLVDIEKNTVDFMPNYDDRLQEPTVLPAQIPALLISTSFLKI